MPTALTEAFIAVAECMESYFYVSDLAVQSAEVKDSMAKFGWAWLELPEFPVRKLFPAAAKALQQFPEHRGLVLAIADWCTDACKQSVIAKLEALRCRMLQGLCLAAGHLALRGRFDSNGYMIAGRIFEAMQKAAETPSIQFYSRPIEVKDEFYSAARDAWREVGLETVVATLEEPLRERFGAVNHALRLTAYFLRNHSGVVELTNTDHSVATTQLYLEVLKSMGEAFGNTFPGLAGNTAFQRYLKGTLRGIQAGSSLPGSPFGDCANLAKEALLIYERTINPLGVPWDQRNPCLLTALNAHHQQISDVSQLEISAEVIAYSELRKDVRREILGIAGTCAAADAKAGVESSSAGPSGHNEDTKNEQAGDASTSKREGRAKERACAKCGTTQKQRGSGEPAFKKCSRCMSTYYCGPQCQKAHWKEHKPVCVSR
ncbi:hypothetical protein KFL_007360020 [Klebsormidium nitens]|uniref:MYND-type domain-containing protein n=1 Tax=Klebsormidium nitens TaxID=105231 RepID=A0A1Y1IJX0_KLENI|nr:hypothetical protein KFL_007360020 [Klebsormidium nitens]|eukprot:GAQ91155.1 hypothetical protein KFL_007360020 [Klebsormidium nitens]